MKNVRATVRRFIAQRLELGTELDFLNRETRQVLFVFGLSFIGALTLTGFGITYILNGRPERALIDFAFTLLAMANLAYLRRLKNVIAASNFILCLMLVLTAFLLVSGGLHDTGFLWLFTIPILAFFLQGLSRGVWWVVATLVIIQTIGLLGAAGWLDIPYAEEQMEQVFVGLTVVSAMLGLFELVTERYEEELLVKDRELEKFKQAVDATTDGIVMTDVEANIIYVNPAWERLTGYSASQALGQNPRILQSGKTDPAEHQRLWQNLAAGLPFKSEKIINRRRDGSEYTAELQIFPVRLDGKNIFYVGLQEDISERVRLDAAKTEFVSLASHQLTTPLSAIAWFTELLMDNTAGPLPPKQRSIIGKIQLSNERMITLVTALLNTSRIDLGTFEVAPILTDLPKLIRQVVREVRATGPTPRIIVDLDVSLPPILLDQNLMTIIVQNLITNAVRYTPRSGRVTVRLQAQRNVLILQVADTGIGIAEHDRQQMFTKMFRSRAAQAMSPNGNGLGLYIVKAIVEQSGGSISFTSKPKIGTTFTVKLPRSGMRAKAGSRALSA
ncbi:MAG: PAS domain S-box protein [Candidatus Kerfeldbacteria bacterium]|nr:PAS domain S-box protein [Candidatus Kerfeldbacteria bacterium]